MSARGGSARGTPPPRSHSQSTSRSSSSTSSRGQGDDNNTPRPEDRAQRPSSRRQSVQRTRYARTNPPAADRELNPSSDDPLASPVFVPEQSPALAGTSGSAVERYMQAAYNTQREGGSWADDDVGMESLPPSGVPSRESTVPRSLRSLEKRAQQAREDPYPSALNIQESLQFVAQWLSDNIPRQNGDEIEREAEAVVSNCLQDLAHVLRTTGWANMVSPEAVSVFADGQSEEDHTIRTPLPPPPLLPPGVPYPYPPPRGNADEDAAMEDSMPAPPPREHKSGGRMTASGRRPQPRPLPGAPIVEYQRAGPPPPRPPRNPLRGKPVPRASSAVPNPPPAKAGTYSAAASKPKSSRKSQAEHLVQLARAAPAASPSAIVKIAQESSESTRRKKGKTPKYTIHGPSRRMVLIQFKLGEDVPTLDAHQLRTGVNKALVQSQSSLRMESGDFAYGGYGLNMNGVASQQELDILRGAVINICKSAEYQGEPWVGLPQSTSYLKIRNAPYFRGSDLSV
ncbi:hypothetical protein MD484_g8846, partial [Candolleomyces efflorescens]